MKSPEQIMARMYMSALVIMVLLLVAAGVASSLGLAIAEINLPTLMIRFYLLIIPAVLLAFSITMLVRRVFDLAIGGSALSLLWLVFKWLG